MTDKCPIQLNSGELGCPDCKIPLEVGLVPYNLDGLYLGSFDGLICPICRYGLFSEKGYIECERM